MKIIRKTLLFTLLFLMTAGNFLISKEEINPSAEPTSYELAIQYAHNPKNWPALHYAIEQNRLDVAELILQIYPEQATQSTPTIKVLNSHMGNNASDDYDYIVGHEQGISALELAICKGHTELVSQLLEMGADVNEFRKEYRGKYANHWEPRGGWVYERCKFGDMDHWTARSPLYWAINKEDSTMVALLLEHGATLTPCHTTQKWAYYASPRITTKTSALKIAATQESTAVFKQLLVHQAGGHSLDEDLISLFRDFVTNPENLPALHYALSTCDIDSYMLLLEHGFDIHDQGEELIARAVEAKDSRFLELLLAREDQSSAALTYAVAIGNIDTVRYLIEQTAATPELLKLALTGGNPDIAKIILTQPHSMTKDGEALTLAIQKGYDEVVALMIEMGYSDKEALAKAIEYNRLNIVEALITQDPPSDEEVPNHIKHSIELGRVEIIRLFLNHYLPSDEQLTQYKRWAIEYNQLDILLFLSNCY